MAALSTLVFANVLHGAVALLWAVVARRLLARSSVELAATLMSLSLVMPLVAAAAHILGWPALPQSWSIVRVERWVELGRLAELPVATLGSVLVGGTAVAFVVQELAPALTAGRSVRRLAQGPDPRLDAALARVLAAYRRSGLLHERRRPPRITRLEADRPVAALSGAIRPHIYVSRGLLDQVDDDQLDAVVAHEAAHWLQGGNLKLLGLWLVRAAQATSPAALVAFRSLVDLHEISCDALASRATEKPAALASSILVAARPNAARGADAITELLLRGERALTKNRVRALLDGKPEDAPRGTTIVSALLMGGLLWLIR